MTGTLWLVAGLKITGARASLGRRNSGNANYLAFHLAPTDGGDESGDERAGKRVVVVNFWPGERRQVARDSRAR